MVGLGALGLLAMVPAACRSSGPAAGGPLGWDGTAAVKADGTAPKLSAQATCGSSTDTYLAELLHVAPAEAKVPREWGDAVAGGKQVAVSGTVATTHLGPTDLPMSHPFGDDLSMDIRLDRPFVPFTQSLGTREGAPDELHVELSSGLIPHASNAGPGAPPVGQTWRQASDTDLTGFLPGFDRPPVGADFLGMGRWIVDCGHDNFQTELHPLSFLAWTQTAGAATVARPYGVPYRDTETYSPNAAVLGKVSDTTRFSDAQAQPFVPYLVNDVIRVATGQSDRLHSQELIEATRVAPPSWRVCAPKGGSGPTTVRYDIVTRSGVSVVLKPSGSCVTVRTTIDPGYHPLDVATRQCAIPWTYLDGVVKDALHTTVDVQQLVARSVPAALRSAVNRDPDATCADPLRAPAVSEAPAGQRIAVDDGQPFPFVGVVTVSRG
jgi:hypothetical protein